MSVRLVAGVHGAAEEAEITTDGSVFHTSGRVAVRAIARVGVRLPARGERRARGPGRMRRVKVELNPGWHIYVEGEERGPGDVVEVAPDHARHLVDPGVAEPVTRSADRNREAPDRCRGGSRAGAPSPDVDASVRGLGEFDRGATRLTKGLLDP